MDNQALARLEALRRCASPRVRHSLGLESRMPSKWPVRFGRGRLVSLARGPGRLPHSQYSGLSQMASWAGVTPWTSEG